MGLFWLEGGKLSPYHFAQTESCEDTNDTIEAAFRRLKQTCTTAPDDDARPVVEEPGPRLLGILSDRDGLLMSADMTSVELAHTTVESVMSAELLTAAPETRISLIAETMVDYKISSLPVLDLDQLLVGIVTTSDVLRSIARHAPLDLWV